MARSLGAPGGRCHRLEAALPTLPPPKCVCVAISGQAAAWACVGQVPRRARLSGGGSQCERDASPCGGPRVGGGHTRLHYSVAQHCVLVSRLVPPALALAGLLHDAAEAYVGDVVGPLARRLPEFRAVEHRILDAVAARFGVPRWQFEAHEVRHADAVALLTEREALLPPSPHPWAEDLAEVAPARGRVVPLAPQGAKAQFLRRLRRLQRAGRR